MPRRRRHGIASQAIVLGIVAITAVVYAKVAGHRFVYVDDGSYILDNVHVNGGLSWDGIVWAFTAFHSGNWHPLTWISHMVDAQLFGVTPAAAGGHHLMSVGLHALNAVLLFVALQRMTGHRWASALVAALFAVHPLRVESVAWASERKDVLSGLFFMLTLLAYADYAKRPGIVRYGWVVVSVAAGLLAKPMLVTVPFVLLLLDLWPLERWRPGWSAAPISHPATEAPARSLRDRLGEKLPLLALCLGSSIATVAAQRRGESVSGLSDLSLAWRLVELPISYSTYLWKTLWPTGLAFFYPHPSSVASGIEVRVAPAVLTGLFLLAATAAVAMKARAHPYLLVGWFWFLGMLIPVIGLLQLGAQAWADRYAYLPLIGIYVMVAFRARDRVARHPRARVPATAAACVAITALSIMAWRQVDAWRDTRALLEHAALVTRDNWLAHNDLGVEVSREGRLEEGRRHFDEALRIRPNYASPHSNLGFSYFFEGRLDEARDECERALEIQPDSPEGHFVLACVLDRQGDLDAARAHFERAIRIRPQYAEAHFRLGLTLRAQGRIGEARHHFEEALRLKPDDLQTELNLAALLAESSRSNPREQNEAVALLGRVAERMHDQGPTSVATLAAAFAAAGRFDEAVQWQARALAIAPDTLASNYRASLERYRAAATGSVGRGDPR